MTDSKVVSPLSSSSSSSTTSSSNSSSSSVSSKSSTSTMSNKLGRDSAKTPPPQEQYLTGLEGHGKIDDSSTEFEIPEQETLVLATPSDCSSVGTIAPSESLASVTSSEADLEKRATKTYEIVQNLLEAAAPRRKGLTSDSRPSVLDMDSIQAVVKLLNEDTDNFEESSSFKDDDRNVVLIDYELYDFDQLTQLNDGPIPVLSKLMNLRVKYMLKDTGETRYELFVVKIPPEYEEERALASTTMCHEREIFFYKKIAPFLQEWSSLQNVDALFAIPFALYGKHYRVLDKNPIDMPNFHSNISSAESFLILDDLRVEGFGKRHFIEGLSVDEVKAALCEICKIHVASWAFHQKDGYQICELYQKSNKHTDIAALYDTLLQNGFKILKAHLSKNIVREPGMFKILEKIRSMELRLKGILLDLLDPPKWPSPISLIHMDFWCDNILFRKRDPYDIIASNTSAPPTTTGDGGGGRPVDDDAQVAKYLEYITDPVYASLDFKNNIDSIIANANKKKMEVDEGVIDEVDNDLGNGNDMSSSSGVGANNLANKFRIEDSPLECRIIDWQMFSYSSPMHDVATLLSTSLNPELRRKYTDMFIKYYHQVFEQTAHIYRLKVPFDYSLIRRQYKRSQVFATLLTIASIEIALSDEATEERLIELLKDVIVDNIV